MNSFLSWTVDSIDVTWKSADFSENSENSDPSPRLNLFSLLECIKKNVEHFVVCSVVVVGVFVGIGWRRHFSFWNVIEWATETATALHTADYTKFEQFTIDGITKRNKQTNHVEQLAQTPIATNLFQWQQIRRLTWHVSIINVNKCIWRFSLAHTEICRRI